LKINVKTLLPILAAVGGAGGGGYLIGRGYKRRSKSQAAAEKMRIARYFYDLGQRNMYLRIMKQLRAKAQ